MLTGYIRFPQKGIESLETYNPPVKDPQTSHYYFDDIRIALKYNFNKVDRISGVSALVFAPNGNIWCPDFVYCAELDQFASYYNAIATTIEEATKSKSKYITIFVDNQSFVDLVNIPKEAPYKDKIHNQIHKYVIDKLKKFESYEIIFRSEYPKDVLERLNKEAITASEALRYDNRGRIQNIYSKAYFSLIDPPEEEIRPFIEQLARMFIDQQKSYAKQYIADYGEEAFNKLMKNFKDGKIKELPDTKEVKSKKQKVLKIKDNPTFDKDILCQKCTNKMELENAFKIYPEKIKKFVFRCKKCFAFKELDKKGRVLVYGKYPRKI